jgi:acyl-CoA thioesterase I
LSAANRAARRLAATLSDEVVCLGKTVIPPMSVQGEGEAMSKSRLNCGSVFASVLAFLLIFFSSSAHAQIVAFGASNVSGWNVAASQAYSAQLQSMLRAEGYRVKVLNAGIYGNTTTQMRNRMETDIPAGTTIVILDTSGGFFNNATKGISREQGHADMAAIAARLKARGISIIPEATVGLPATYKQQDGRHLTPEGHELVASQLLPKIVEALGPPPPPQAVSTDVTNACRADAKRLCQSALGDAERRHACMHEHRAELSRDCRNAIAKSRQPE